MAIRAGARAAPTWAAIHSGLTEQCRTHPDALLLGGVEARGDPRDIQGCARKNPHGTRGCRTHVGRIGLEVVWKRRTGLPQKSVWEQPRSKGCQTRCRWQVSRLLKVHEFGHVTAEALTEQKLPHTSRCCCWEVSRLVEIPRISRNVPAKILTEQGAAAPMLAEVVWKRQTGLPQKSIWKQPKLVWEHRGRRPEVSIGVRIGPNAFGSGDRKAQTSMCQQTEQGAAAHMSKLLDVVKTFTPEGPGICWHMTQKWSGSC